MIDNWKFGIYHYLGMKLWTIRNHLVAVIHFRVCCHYLHEFTLVGNIVQHNISKSLKVPDREFLLRMSYMEIYNEEINDLLAPEHRRLQIHESLEVLIIGVLCVIANLLV